MPRILNKYPDYTYRELKSMTFDELKKVTTSITKVANQRMVALEKAGLQMFSRSYMNRAEKTPSGATLDGLPKLKRYTVGYKDIEALAETYVQAWNFLSTTTSTVAGARRQRDVFSKETDGIIEERSERWKSHFWELFSKMKDESVFLQQRKSPPEEIWDELSRILDRHRSNAEKEKAAIEYARKLDAQYMKSVNQQYRVTDYEKTHGFRLSD